MALVEQVKSDERGRHIRGTGRLNSRVPITIEGKINGQVVRAEGYTKDISPKGCMAVVPQGFAVGEKLRITNLVNQNSIDGFLIWRGHEGPAGWELGIELQEGTGDFWGLDF